MERNSLLPARAFCMDLSAIFSPTHCRCAAKGLKTLTLFKDLAKHTLFKSHTDKNVIHFKKKTKTVSGTYGTGSSKKQHQGESFFSLWIFPAT